jgi:hypothetical protein
MSSKKAKSIDAEKPDYLRLPFEVYYSGPISVTSYEFKSDADLKSFKDIKAVHMERGKSWGVSFLCKSNQGPRLYCCLIDGHDEIAPEWLELQNEDNVSMNYGRDYKVVINGKEILFVDEEVNGIDEMDYCGLDGYWHYEIASESPEYFILDALNTRVKINGDGYPIDDDGKPTGAKQLIDVANLNAEELEDYSSDSIWDGKSEWVRTLIGKNFPKDKGLQLSFDSE